jgi:hypothetical protein
VLVGRYCRKPLRRGRWELVMTARLYDALPEDVRGSGS